MDTVLYSRSLELILYKETLYPLGNNFSFLYPHQPLATTILFSASVALTMLDSLYKWNHAVFSFCDCLISLSIMPSRLIHIVADVRNSFIFKAE